MKLLLKLGLTWMVAMWGMVAVAQSTNGLDVVTLEWNPSARADLKEYRLYATQDTNLWTHVKVVPVGGATRVDVILNRLGTWWFTVTVRDQQGLESLPAQAVQYEVEAVPPALDGLRVISAVVTRISTITTTTNLILLP